MKPTRIEKDSIEIFREPSRYLKKKYSGCYEIPSYQAVNKAKNNMWRIGNDSEQRDLSEKFDRLWESYTASSKEKSSRLPIVPNNVYALS